MSYDALFQLGMGAVLLNASQTEEFLRLNAAAGRTPVIGAMDSRRHTAAVMGALRGPYRLIGRSRIAYAGAGTANRRLGAMPPPTHRCASNRYVA